MAWVGSRLCLFAELYAGVRSFHNSGPSFTGACVAVPSTLGSILGPPSPECTRQGVFFDDANLA